MSPASDIYRVNACLVSMNYTENIAQWQQKLNITFVHVPVELELIFFNLD
jgi:hypothetical protein